MKYWDEVLYPSFRSFIRGQIYGVMSQDDLDQECYDLAVRAIAAFKFPRISTDYKTFYAIRDPESGVLNEVAEGNEHFADAIPHAYFVEEVSPAEIEVLIAWMKVYWCELQISNADNFEDMYTDSNIKTYSRANAVDKNLKLMAQFRDYARDLENRYSRTKGLKPTIGNVNKDGNEQF